MREEFVVEWFPPAGPRRLRLVPANLGAPELARELASSWVALCREYISPVNILRTAIPKFCAIVARQPGFDASTDGIEALRRRHLDAWERELLDEQAKKKTEQPYRLAVFLSAFLRWIEDEQPGKLHPSVVERVREKTRLSLVSSNPLQDFSRREMFLMRKAARELTHQDRESCDPDVLVALHVLLSVATGQPPEVLRVLTVDDVVASTTDPRGADMDTAVLAASGLATSYAVTIFKLRAHSVDEEVYTRKHDRRVVSLFDDLISRTNTLRQQSGLRSLWLTRGRTGEIERHDWSRPRLSTWLFRHVEEPVSRNHDWRRIRKSAIAKDVMDNTDTFLELQHRHSPSTFFGRYTASPDMRAHMGRLWGRTAAEMFDRAVGPAVVVGGSPVRLDVATQQARPIESKSVPRAYEGALTGCAAPEQSPYADEGETCPVARAGKCFTCPNAVITEAHLPAMILLNEASDPEAAGRLDTWTSLWRDIHRSTATMLTLFPAKSVDEARRRTSEVLVDLGIRQELRGDDEK
ncbi:hypothetical protein [Microbacterium sp. SZ1]|uniref:hypothetical protein n=1 Tax=Microbacterium sp. SZ1 TaxID=1849736 RepID=UPI00117E28FE|nr:hypothetical protein [Microbacterium sp. SZ1]